MMYTRPVFDAPFVVLLTDLASKAAQIRRGDDV